MGCGASKNGGAKVLAVGSVKVRSPSNLKCLHCGELGHGKFNCPELKGETIVREKPQMKRDRKRRASVETYLA
jgi:hypothetical protein